MTSIRLACCFISVVAIQTAWSRPTCTAQDVQGNYAFQADGTVLVPGTPITGPFMRQGYFIADGAGRVNASTLAVYNGINFGQEIYGGTYTVTTDCSIEFKLFIPSPINANATFKGTVANDGEDIMFMLMSTESQQAPAITTVLGHGRRQKVRQCTAKNVTGDYRVEVNGWFGLTLGTATQQRLLGRVHADGVKAITASFVKSIGGAISEESTTGTFTVSPDCTFAMSFVLDTAPTILRGSLIGGGAEAFVALNPQGLPVMHPLFGPIVVNGVVATGTMIQQSISNADH
jgi:hypothetical protein